MCIKFFSVWASSAPVLLFKNGGPDVGAYYNVTSRTWINSGCDETAVLNAFKAIDNLSTTQDGLSKLNSIFKLASNSSMTSKDDVDKFLKPFISNAFESLVEMDYPYATNFLASVPQWPVRVGSMN